MARLEVLHFKQTTSKLSSESRIHGWRSAHRLLIYTSIKPLITLTSCGANRWQIRPLPGQTELAHSYFFLFSIYATSQTRSCNLEDDL